MTVRESAVPATVPLIGVVIAVVTAAALLALVTLVPFTVRHAAPFGAEQTIDFDRGIAVMGGEVSPNYDGFDRVVLDLRGYSDPVPGDRYDLVLTIRDVEAGTTIRTVAFSVDATDIAASRSAFSTLGTAVSFEPIQGSAGRGYYVEIERGPRNATDIVTLWGIQSSSTLEAIDVIGASVRGYDLGLSARTTEALLTLLWVGCLVTTSAAAGAIGAAAWSAGARRTQRL